MNVSRRCSILGLYLTVFAAATGLWAQDPALKLERSPPAAGEKWNGRTTLVFRVTVHHPATRKGGAGEDFVIDPPGGWRGAVRLVVNDAAGRPVDWPFENVGQHLAQPLTLHRLGTASVSFLLRPLPGSSTVPPGRYQVRARLATSDGKWRGRVESPPLTIDLTARAQPELELIGVAASPMRGWPMRLGVKVTAPDGYDGGLAFGTDGADWGKAVGLVLTDAAGATVALTLQRIPEARTAPLNFKPKEERTVWFRVTGDATSAMGDGPYRWVAKLSLPPASRNPDLPWSGTVAATSEPIRFAAPPVPLPADLARRQIRTQIEDALIEAKLPPAHSVANPSASASLARAERLARQWLDAHPDDPEAAVLAANALAAQGDKTRAIDYLYRALAADQKRFAPDDEAAFPSSRALRMMIRDLEAMPDARGAVQSPVLREVANDSRSGSLASAAGPASVPPVATAVSPQTVSTGGGVAPVSPVVGSAPLATSGSIRLGLPSPGTVVPAAGLDDAKVRADPAGQWAVTATAGSFQRNSYNYYTPAHATGEPNVAYAGYNTEAWCPAQQNLGEDWLEVAFARPTLAVAVRVRQTFNPGAIVKVEAIAPDGTVHLWWQGTDPYKRPATREIAWFAVNVPATPYLVAKIRLTLNLASGPGYKQIDAVQLVVAP